MDNPYRFYSKSYVKGGTLVFWLQDFFFTRPFDFDSMH